MYECPECGEKVEEDEVKFDCPFCGETDWGEGFYYCENCGTLFTHEEELWECRYCYNGSNTGNYRPICPECGDEMEDESYCDDCGWPNNQGWIGENYG